MNKDYYYYYSTKALVIKRVTMGGGGVKNCPKLRDVIYGRPLRVKSDDLKKSFFVLVFMMRIPHHVIMVRRNILSQTFLEFFRQ